MAQFAPFYRTKKYSTHASGGFTLIEMIGVLAIIAILVAALSPRIFDAISDSRVTSFVSTAKTLQTAATKYYSDIGTLLTLNNTGNAVADATGQLLPDVLTGQTAAPNPLVNLWTRYRGPYLEKFADQNPPIGTLMTMPTVNAAAIGAAAANNIFTNYDLNNDGNNDLTAGAEIVTLRVTGVNQKEFEKIDAILDEGVGTTLAEKQNRGKVKWVQANGILNLYLAHK
ncbi:MAG: prepilin-type N-terminal cleavage/methylation domain-containing protein [Chitinivibrionales bacterium]|nr:prepilin-type N-terminal cleavage/methylation domain-containing protein [Chitinivibrionales bacterium]